MNKEFDYENEKLEEENYTEYDIEDLEDDEEDFREIILTLDDDTELTCLVVAQYQVENQDYIALLPIEEEEPGDILLYKATYGDDETFDVSMIEDEEEFEVAADAYYRHLDENEIDLEDLHYHHHHDHDHDHHHDHHHDFDDYEEEYDEEEYEDGFEVDYLEDDDFEDDQD